jgi:hypothetical protein
MLMQPPRLAWSAQDLRQLPVFANMFYDSDWHFRLGGAQAHSSVTEGSRIMESNRVRLRVWGRPHRGVIMHSKITHWKTRHSSLNFES